MYETPALQVVELKLMKPVLVGSNPDDPFDGSTEKTPEVE
jgi:hypothetical protein